MRQFLVMLVLNMCRVTERPTRGKVRNGGVRRTSLAVPISGQMNASQAE